MYSWSASVSLPALGFLWGWTMYFVMHAGILAAIAVVLARYLGYFFGFGDTGVRLLAMAAILLVSFIQYLGVKPGSAVQVVTFRGKGLRRSIAMRADFHTGESGAPGRNRISPTSRYTWPSFGLAVAAGLFAFWWLAHGFIFGR